MQKNAGGACRTFLESDRFATSLYHSLTLLPKTILLFALLLKTGNNFRKLHGYHNQRSFHVPSVK